MILDGLSHSSRGWPGQGASAVPGVVPPAKSPSFLHGGGSIPRGLGSNAQALIKPCWVCQSFIRQSKSHEHVQYPWGNRQVSHSINGIEQNLFKRLFTEVWAGLITDDGKAFVG